MRTSAARLNIAGVMYRRNLSAFVLYVNIEVLIISVSGDLEPPQEKDKNREVYSDSFEDVF